MSRMTPALEKLVAELEKLPSVGPKTALRQALHLLTVDLREAQELAAAVLEARRKVRPCSRCFNYAEEELCSICADQRREQRLLCVVGGIADLYAIERSGGFRGLYHVLGGNISPLEGRGPSDIGLNELLARLRRERETEEVIVATNPSAEGDATAMYILEQVRRLGVPLQVSRIAYGLPVGGEIEYVDDLTMARALSSRREM